MERESNFPPSEEELQRLRESRYQRSIEREKNIEVRETIDIFETPLFFRYDFSLLSYLEYERVGGIRAEGTTFSRIHFPTSFGLRAKSIFLEAPIPYYQGMNLGRKELEENLDNTSKGFENKNARYDNAIWQMAENFHKEFPEIDEEVLAQIIEKSTRLSHQGGQYREDDMKITYEEMEQRQAFIKELLQNPEYRKVWIAAQKIALKKHPIKDHWRARKIGLASQASEERGATFLVSPENADIFTIDASQQHHDFMLEIIAMKDIPEKQILGYLEYPGKDANIKLEKAISAEAAKIYGHGPKKDDSSINFVRCQLNEMINEVATGYWGYQGTKRKVDESDLEKKKKELCTILDIPESPFSAEEAKEKIETMPGIYNRYFEHASYFKREAGKRGISSFPDMPSEELTLKEIEQKIFERVLPKLKELFPFQNFTLETVEQDVETALTKYIIDRFGIDPKETTMKDFVHLVVKSMGIPIYDLQGNQLWPLKKTYEEIHNPTQKE